jgi:hypothetical protein
VTIKSQRDSLWYKGTMIKAYFALFPCYILLHHLYKRFSPERERERERERDLDKEQQQIWDSTSPNALGFKSRTGGQRIQFYFPMWAAKRFNKREKKYIFLRLPTSGMRKHVVLDKVTNFSEQYFYQTTRRHVHDDDYSHGTAVRTLNFTIMFMFTKSDIISGRTC